MDLKIYSLHSDDNAPVPAAEIILHSLLLSELNYGVAP